MKRSPMKRSWIKRKPRPKATAEELARLEAVKSAGSIIAWMGAIYLPEATPEKVRQIARKIPPCQAHHLKDGNQRRGHMFTIGLTPWEHVGDCKDGLGVDEMTSRYGPSLFHDARAFHEWYGSDDRLLELQNELFKLLG